MSKDPTELPLPEPKQATGVRIKEVPVQPAVPVWGWVVIALLVIGIIGGMALLVQRQNDAAKASTQRQAQENAVELAKRTDCALRVAAQYEDYRDAVIVALAVSPDAARAAASAFGEFRKNPDTGKKESRGERTIRECGTAVDATSDGSANRAARP